MRILKHNLKMHTGQVHLEIGVVVLLRRLILEKVLLEEGLFKILLKLPSPGIKVLSL